ncbi:hypothetical protein KAJ27_00170 [bacterium]|nr:hypothetical protein [bacterium]
MAKKIKKKKIDKVETAEFDVQVEEDFLSLKFYSLAYVIIAIAVTFLFRAYFLFYWN